MARVFLRIYVTIHIAVLTVALISLIVSGDAHQLYSDVDWLIFIIACGTLAITEALEENK